MNRRKLTNGYVFNCLTFAIMLFFRGRCKAIIMLEPCHFLGITRNNNIIHFRTTKQRERWAPWLFQGYVEVRKMKSFANLFKKRTK